MSKNSVLQAHLLNSIQLLDAKSFVDMKTMNLQDRFLPKSVELGVNNLHFVLKVYNLGRPRVSAPVTMLFRNCSHSLLMGQWQTLKSKKERD